MLCDLLKQTTDYIFVLLIGIYSEIWVVGSSQRSLTAWGPDARLRAPGGFKGKCIESSEVDVFKIVGIRKSLFFEALLSTFSKSQKWNLGIRMGH